MIINPEEEKVAPRCKGCGHYVPPGVIKEGYSYCEFFKNNCQNINVDVSGNYLKCPTRTL
jgi:hypothetical protein